MVHGFYNLKEEPFGVTPNPRFLYMSGSHREALASLLYAIHERRGFMALVAEPGMGKTTILFKLLDQLKKSARTAYLFQTLCRPEDLLRAMLRDLGIIDDGADLARSQERLNDVFAAEARQGRTVVVVIDEAQNLESSSLELIRMLSNFETADHKLVQIVLAGQLQLREKLASPQLLQLRQRMAMISRLRPFSAEETRAYVEHRLRVAGYDFNRPLFAPEAEALIAQHSDGIPRNINNICFNSLALGCVSKEKTISKEIVREVLDDLNLDAVRSDGPENEPSSHVGGDLSAITGGRQPLSLSYARVALIAAFLVLLGMTSSHALRPRGFATASVEAGAALPKVPQQIRADQVKKPVPAPPDAQDANTKDSENSVLKQTSAQRAPALKSYSSGVPAITEAKAGTTPIPDVSGLWAKVRNGNSEAEVELGKMYLQGTGVAQNCAQAQILLATASLKGNARAADLLSRSADECR